MACLISVLAVQIHGEKTSHIVGRDHFASRGDLKIYLWEKFQKSSERSFSRSGKVVLLVHGGTWVGRTDFDLEIKDYSLMDFLARNGYDAWTIDIHGYGRSSKTDKDWSDTASAAEDINAATDYILKTRHIAKIFLLGYSWGTQTTGLFAMKHPEKVGKLVLCAMAWKGTPALTDRPLLKEQYRVDPGVDRQHDLVAGQYEKDVADKLQDDAVARSPKAPNGGRNDMISHLPMLEPEKITMPTLIVRAEKDYASTEKEVLEFYSRLGTKEKSLVELPNSGHGMIFEKEHRKLKEVLLEFFDQR